MRGTRGRPGRLAVRLAGGVALVAALTACGGTAEDPDPGSTPSSTDAGEDGPIEVDVTITNAQVNASEGRIRLDVGDSVIMSVTSDVDDTIHVHGVDELLVLEAGVEGVLEFEVPPGVPSGLYDVEAHDGALSLFELRIR